jgi:hypothetical protein
MVGLLAAAAALRLIGIGFGLPFPYANPDEHLVTDHALLMTAGDWNPHYFAYPSLSFELHALLAFVVAGVGRVAGAWSSLAEFRTHCWLDPAPMLLASRLFTAAMAVATVWAVGRIAAELARAARPGDRRFAGKAQLLGAAAIGLCWLHVSNSRWVTVDAPCVMFVALSLAHALRHARKGARRDLVLAAVFGGLAASSKYYGALTAVAIAFATSGGAARLAPLREGVWEGRPGRAWIVLRNLSLAGAVMLATFVATSPFVVLDWSTFTRDFGRLESHMEGGHFGHDPSRNGAWVYLQLLFSARVGAWIMVPAIAAIVALQFRRRARLPATLLLVPLLAHFGIVASFKSQPADYLLALLPGLCAFAGVALAWLPFSFAFAAPLAIGGWLALQEGLALRRPDSRVLLRSWIEVNVRSGASVAADTWLELPFTLQCVEQMAAGREQALGAPLRRSRDEPIEQVRARLAAARARPPDPAWDFALLTPREIDLGDSLFPLLREHGFRWLVLDGTRAARSERSGGAFAARAAWYRRVMNGAGVVARFDPANGEASGPPLVVIDLEKLR